MVRLQVNPGFAELLRRHGLDDYTSIMNSTAGELIEQPKGRETRLLQLDGHIFFLKRVYAEKLASALESYFGGKLAHSKPYREMLHYRFLRTAGFDVAEVVVVGETLKLGMPQSGFIMTRKVDGRDLSELYRESNSRQRRHIMVNFATLVGKLHQNGFFGSIRLKDIISNDAPGTSMQLVLIDREVRNPYPKGATTQRALSRLLLNIRRQTRQGEVFSDREWGLFCRFYCHQVATSPPIKSRFLRHEVKQLVQRLSGRDSRRH